MSDAKGEKVYGGLIRREKRVTTSKEGHTETQHWDGRKDVNIKAEPLKVKFMVQNLGSE